MEKSTEETLRHISKSSHSHCAGADGGVKPTGREAIGKKKETLRKERILFSGDGKACLGRPKKGVGKGKKFQQKKTVLLGQRVKSAKM